MKITLITVLFVVIIILFLERVIKEIQTYNQISILKKESEIKINQLNKTISSLSYLPVDKYELDMKFLNDMINHSLTNFTVFILKPRITAGYVVIENSLFEEWREDLVVEILDKLSPNYKKVLKNYFSHEGLNEYVIERVNTELIERILSLKLRFEK